MTGRIRVASTTLVLAAAIVGCGSGGDGATGGDGVSVVDGLLRPVLRHAPEDARAGIRYVGSDLSFGAPDPGPGQSTLVLASTTFPAWGSDRRVRDVGVVANDRVVLLRRAADVGGVGTLPGRGMILRVSSPGTSESATSAAFERLAADRLRGRTLGLQSTPVASASAAAAEVRASRADGALVMGSTVGRVPAGLRVVRLARRVAPLVQLQIGTVRASTHGTRLRAWLTGVDGRRALAEGGFGAPDPDQAARR